MLLNKSHAENISQGRAQKQAVIQTLMLFIKQNTPMNASESTNYSHNYAKTTLCFSLGALFKIYSSAVFEKSQFISHKWRFKTSESHLVA